MTIHKGVSTQSMFTKTLITCTSLIDHADARAVAITIQIMPLSAWSRST